MGALRIVLTIIFILVSVALSAIVLMQEGKSAGFTGSISGIADSYWGKNKAHSMEGKLQKSTTWLVVVFFVICLILNSRFFHTEANANQSNNEPSVEQTTEAGTEATTEPVADPTE